MEQLPLAIAHRPEPTLDSFVVGDNQLAWRELQWLAPATATLEAGAVQGAPTYLWGPSGSGKTHLLQALAARWCQQGGAVAAFAAGRPLPWQVSAEDAQHALLLSIDGCEALDPAEQRAAFGLLIEAAAQAGWRVLAAGRLPPVDLPLRDDLRSRLGWGHVLALHPLPDEDVRHVLRTDAARRGLRLPDPVLDHLLTHDARDLKHLLAQLDRLDRYALVHRRAVTLPLLREALGAGEAPAA